MPTALEIEINTLLSEKSDVKRVGTELVRRWRHHLFNDAEADDCARFLVISGQLELFFMEIRRLIEEGAKLPWAQLGEALGKSGMKPDSFEIDSLLEAAASQEATAELLRSRQLDLFSREFAKQRETLNRAKQEEMLLRKQQLREKIDFMRAQRMFDQELQLLEELQSLFPSESGIEKDKEELRLRWAREIVSGARASADTLASDLESKAHELTPAEQVMKSLIVERAIELAKASPSFTCDLAIGMHMMDLHMEALKILEHAPTDRRADWLKLELLIRARQFVTAMEETVRLEEKYADDPETTFATTYARAQALHGLGERAAAIELLEGLTRIRPHYRSAQSLLLDWTGGES